MQKTPFFILSITVIFSLVIGCISIFMPRSALGKVDTETTSEKNSNKNQSSAINYETVKAVWISQFDMWDVYTENLVQREIGDYTEKVEKIIQNISEIGINTVYFQLRPNGDSIYPSSLYPASKYSSGGYGKELVYDPFQIFLQKAHSRSISVHAWINPLRCMSEADILSVPHGYAVRDWYDTKKGSYIVTVDGYCYLNPAYAETRKLIKDGICEIIEKYDVDGVHIDDYFYPTTDESFDAEAYSIYSEKTKKVSLADFRRERINILVRDIYSAVKSHNPSLLFGISPSGNSARNFNELYADVSLWCSEEGYIDYICPQIYFGFEHETHAFDKVFDEFSEMVTNDRVKFIVGITVEKALNGYMNIEDKWAGDGAREWIENSDVLKKSAEYASRSQGCDGISLFSYRLLFDTISGMPKEETSKECQSLYFVLKKI